MELEKQCVSLELSKKLEELGVSQGDSIWWWRDGVGTQLRCREYPAQFDTSDCYEAYDAFTVSELGNLLKEAGPEATIKSYGDIYNFQGTGAIGSIGLLKLLTSPDELAKMLIYLLENNLIN